MCKWRAAKAFRSPSSSVGAVRLPASLGPFDLRAGTVLHRVPRISFSATSHGNDTPCGGVRGSHEVRAHARADRTLAPRNGKAKAY
eukprot:6893538-Prymnesium_polylepis.2